MPASMTERRVPQRMPGGQCNEQIDKPERNDGTSENQKHGQRG